MFPIRLPLNGGSKLLLRLVLCLASDRTSWKTWAWGRKASSACLRPNTGTGARIPSRTHCRQTKFEFPTRPSRILPRIQSPERQRRAGRPKRFATIGVSKKTKRQENQPSRAAVKATMPDAAESGDRSTWGTSVRCPGGWAEFLGSVWWGLVGSFGCCSRQVG